MDLTWRDAVSTLALMVMLAIYALYLSAGSHWLLSSAWATAAVSLIVGLGGLVVSVRGDARHRPRELFRVILRITVAVFGAIALFAGVTALLFNSAYSLKILIMASIIVWCATIATHIMGPA